MPACHPPHPPAGHEIGSDALTLAQFDVKSRSVVMCQVSPEPNKFTLTPSEARACYEATSVAWMMSQAVRE